MQLVWVTSSAYPEWAADETSWRVSISAKGISEERAVAVYALRTTTCSTRFRPSCLARYNAASASFSTSLTDLDVTRDRGRRGRR